MLRIPVKRGKLNSMMNVSSISLTLESVRFLPKQLMRTLLVPGMREYSVQVQVT